MSAKTDKKGGFGMIDKDIYEINKNTCAIIATENNKAKVIETENTIVLETKTLDIMKRSCEYYGSTLEGRVKGSKSQLGMRYKLPVIVEESKEIIFFPTTSLSQKDCSWINLKAIKSYEKKEFGVSVTFEGNYEQIIPISYDSFENQVFRATKLLLILQHRKNN